MSLPLVSCIMPTKNRREFVPKAIEYFLRQTYPNKELVIVDDVGADDIQDLLPQTLPRGASTFYLRVHDPLTLGAKRNRCVQAAKGDLIAHWDDDDWYGPGRLANQVALMQAYGTEVCGVDTPLFYDLITGASFRYRYRGPGRYLYSATLMFTRKYWERSPFPDMQVGAGTPFVCGPGRLDDSAIEHCDNWYTGIAHAGNNSPKPFKTASEFTRWDGDMEARLGADWPFYQGLRERMGVAA